MAYSMAFGWDDVTAVTPDTEAFLNPCDYVVHKILVRVLR